MWWIPPRAGKSLHGGRIRLQEPVPLPGNWAKVFADDTYAAGAMLDRLLHRSVVFTTKGTQTVTA